MVRLSETNPEQDRIEAVRWIQMSNVVGGSMVANRHEYGYNEGHQRTNHVFTQQIPGGFIQTRSMSYTYDDIGQLKTARGWEADGITPRLHEQFGYANDAAWNLNWRTNNQLKQQFNVDNRNQLTTAARTGTLTVAGVTGERKASWEGDYGVTNVNVVGTGLASGPAQVYEDGSWARQGATPASGNNTYIAVGRDSYGRQSTDSVVVYTPATVTFSYDLNGNLLSDGLRTFEYDYENQLTNVYDPGVNPGVRP